MPELPALLVGLSQATVLRLDVNPVTLLLGVVGFIGTALLAALTFFLRRLLASFDLFKAEVRARFGRVEHAAATSAREVQAIRQELVGLDGTNGIKGKQRDMDREMRRQSRVLNRLAVEAGVEPDSGDPGDGEAHS